jgi:hypothetical protein
MPRAFREVLTASEINLPTADKRVIMEIAISARNKKEILWQKNRLPRTGTKRTAL